MVALDGEVNNSTYAEDFAKAHRERYFEMYIAEQQRQCFKPAVTPLAILTMNGYHSQYE